MAITLTASVCRMAITGLDIPDLVAAWHWPAADAHELEEKPFCLEAVLELHPQNENAPMRLLALGSGRADD